MSNFRKLDNRIIVNTSDDLSGVLDSSKQYFINGDISVSNSIDVPAGGLTIVSYGFENGSLTYTGTNGALFESPVGGSGNLIIEKVSVSSPNVNTAILALVDSDGTHACEFSQVNFNNCNSLGYLDGYRQGLEQNTGRFGGSPSLEFRGTWSGGYFIQTSITRGINDTTYSLFSGAVGQSFASRFGGNPNIFVPSNVTVFEFSEANFINDELLQLDNATFSGTGTIFSGGVDETSVKARVASNTRGSNFTSVGGTSKTTTAVQTILTQDTPVKIEGTRTYSNLTWFSNGGVNDALTYISNQPTTVFVEYIGSFVASNNTTYEITIRHWDDSAGVYIDQDPITFTTNGGIASDRAEGVSFISERITLNINDRIERWITNITNNNNPTERVNSRVTIKEAK